jgi:hypothetical protein
MRGEKRERGRDSEYSNISTPDKKARLLELEEQAKRLVSEELADVDEAGLLPLGTGHACKLTDGWLTFELWAEECAKFNGTFTDLDTSWNSQEGIFGFKQRSREVSKNG